MNLVPLGHGFCKAVVDQATNTSIYYFCGKRIEQELLDTIPDPDHPTEADVFTCEMAMGNS